VAALRENAEVLAAWAAQLQHQEAAIEALTGTLVRKDALFEV
jgi:hypothetical protein